MQTTSIEPAFSFIEKTKNTIKKIPVRKTLSSIVPKKIKRPLKEVLERSLFKGISRIFRGKYDALLWFQGQRVRISVDTLLLRGYCQGVVPLPSLYESEVIEWHDPDFRGIVPVEEFKVQKDLWRRLKKQKLMSPQEKFEIRINNNFKETIEACAKPRKETNRTYLTPDYIKTCLDLHEMGIAHSIETYQNGILVGGVIGFAINSYFADITLFHHVDNASKVAYYYLLVKLKESGFKLHDSGWTNSWFGQYGMEPMPRSEFRQKLASAITTPAKFTNQVPEIIAE
jgi:leucyl/phenylalanyl-tRNA--protein transferase